MDPPLDTYHEVDVSRWSKGQSVEGKLRLETHHIVFSFFTSTTETHGTPRRQWIAYPMISSCIFRSTPTKPPAICLGCRDFTYTAFRFGTDVEGLAVFRKIKQNALRTGRGEGSRLENLYAFTYKSASCEVGINGWDLYDPMKEFTRMGVITESNSSSRSGWRISKINESYAYCDTYPRYLCVPSVVSDNILRHIDDFRSRCRIPILSYKYALNDCTITRAAQPKAGVSSARSPQDEKLVNAIFATTQPFQHNDNTADDMLQASEAIQSQQMETRNSQIQTGSILSADAPPLSQSSSGQSLSSHKDSNPKTIYGAQQKNLIADARPHINTVFCQLAGGGSENMDGYPTAHKVCLNIENITVMRSSLKTLVDILSDADSNKLQINLDSLERSKWRKHISLLLAGSNLIARTIAINHSHVLIHCSDGWDRTSQLSALAQLCLDPYYRTMRGFMILVEKDWLSFGHMFRVRSGLLGHAEWFKIEKDLEWFKVEKDSVTIGDHDIQHGDEPTDMSTLKVAFQGVQNFFRRQPNAHELEGSSPQLNESVSSEAMQTKDVSDCQPKEMSPVFHQFLDATYQLLRQFPDKFEFNERFLRRLLYHLYSCQYGTFLFQSDKERHDWDARSRTNSVWDYFLSREEMFKNPVYNPEIDENVQEKASLLLPDDKTVRWWTELFGYSDEVMNGSGIAINSVSDYDNGGVASREESY